MRLHAHHPLHMAIGLSAWFAWFCMVYGGLSVACVVAPPAPELGPHNWVNGTLLLLTVAAFIALAWGAWVCLHHARALPGESGQSRHTFAAKAAAALYGAAAVSTLVVGLPLLLLTPCV